MTDHDNIHQQLVLNTQLKIRVAQASDVSKLEWNGQFTHFRNLFKRAYDEQQQGRRIMLVMDFNEYPIARLFIQFLSSNQQNTHIIHGYIYSFNVMEPFRNLGIGTHLLNTAEAILTQRHCMIATISVAKHNKRAYKLYSRHGYEIYAEDDGKWDYVDHEGTRHHVNEPSWLMKKTLPQSTNHTHK
jgi:ribosomal protein S18 acetylase RimI-like enzyme